MKKKYKKVLEKKKKIRREDQSDKYDQNRIMNKK